MVDHWDHVCQLAGDSLHMGFESDLDSVFGTEQSPHDLSSIADLRQYRAILARRGGTNADIETIFHKNWTRLPKTAWTT